MLLVTLSLLIFGISFDSIQAYHVETRFPVIFNLANAGSEPRSQFGESVLLKQYSERDYRVIISAPNSSYASLYQCPWADGKRCQDVRIQATQGLQLGVSKLGLNLVERPKHPGQYLACAHLKTLYYTYQARQGPSEYTLNPTGSCYLINKDRTSHWMSPLDDINQQTINGDKKGYNFGYGMAGFSSTFTSNGRRLFLGAPGLWDWKGGVLEMNELNRVTQVEMKQYKNNTKDVRDIYMGYAIAQGQLCQGQLCIALAVPRDNLTGSVRFFAFDAQDKFKPTEMTLWGRETGEYFGSSLLTIDINGDQLDDLLVGAPFYASHRKGFADEGRVAVYLARNNQKKNLAFVGNLLGGKVSDARFGTAMASLGDINKDGIEDVVISAPYEDNGRGSIYIYHGTRNDLPHLMQKISAAQHLSNHKLLGFGISMSSSGNDVDQNGVPDLLVGSYLSNKAVLLRSRTSIKLSASFQIDNDKVDFNQTCIYGGSFNCFRLNYCFRYPQLDTQLEVNVTLTLDAGQLEARCFLKKQNKQTRYLNQVHQLKNGEFCSPDLIVYVHPLQSIQNLRDSMQLLLTYTQKETRLTAQNIFQIPKIDETNPNLTGIIDFSLCTKGSDCASNIQVNARVWIDDRPSGLKNDLVQGTYHNISIRLNVTNLEDAAFGTHVNITANKALSLIKLDHKCSYRDKENTSEIICRLDSPLYDWDSIEFKLNPFTSGGIIQLNVSTFVSNQMSDQSRPNQTIIFNSKKFASLKLTIGNHPIKQYNLSSEPEQAIKFYQTFKLTKQNQSLIELVELSFVYPSRVAWSGASLVTPLQLTRLNPNQAQVPLKCDQPVAYTPKLTTEKAIVFRDRKHRNVDCSLDFACDVVRCKLGPLKSSAPSVDLKYSSQLNLTAIDLVSEGMEYDDIMFNVHIEALILDDEVMDNKRLIKHVQFSFQEKMEPTEPTDFFWPLVIGILFGILILVAVILVCRYFGFFNRVRPSEPNADD